MPHKKASSGNAVSSVNFSLIAGLFLTSLSVLVLQISFTRIFSVFVGYHFVFIAVSTAMLGIGLGAMLFYKLRAKITSRRSSFKVLGLVALAFSLSILFSLAAVAGVSSPETWFIYIVEIFPPFFLAGVFLALSYHQFASQSNLLYFADLTGAAFGSLVVVLLLQSLGGINAVGVTSVFPAMAGIILLKRERKTHFLLSLLIFFAVVLFVGLNMKYGFLMMNLSAAGKPHKTLLKLIKEEKGRIIHTDWNAFSRVDVVEHYKRPDVRTIFVDGGAGTDMLRFEGNFNEIKDRLKQDIGFFPYYFTQPKNTLIIGPGGGKDVLFALLGKSEHITAVEINPSVIRAIKKFSRYNGDILYYRDVHWVLDEGRSFISRTQDRYDMLYLSKVYTGVAEIAGYALMENYIYTTEAVGQYLSHLNREGYLVFLVHQPGDLTRLFNTLMEILQRNGRSFEEAAKHIFVIHSLPPYAPPSRPIEDMLLIYRNTPFSEAESEKMAKGALALEFTPFFSSYFTSPGKLWLKKFQFRSGLDFNPVSDNSPFFFNYAKGIPAPLRNLLVIFLIAVLFLFVLYLAPRKKRQPNQSKRYATSFLFYFFLLGLGFMFVEISLIQRFMLFLGYPTLSISTTLFSLLLGGGAGSLVYNRIGEDELGFYLKFALAMNFALIAIYLIVLPRVFQVFISQKIIVRSLIAMGLLIPVGFFLGIPFPSGLRILKRAFPSEVAWMWGINGVSSTLGCTLSVSFGVLYGFSQTLLAGGVCYLLAFSLTWWMKKRNRTGG